jgi:hypothetical protein
MKPANVRTFCLWLALTAACSAPPSDGSPDFGGDPANPTRIQLCEALCKAAVNARMEVQFGCETVVALR